MLFNDNQKAHQYSTCFVFFFCFFFPGNQFDIKEFHDQVLKHGRVPMMILEGIINDWIKSYTGERTSDFEGNYYYRPASNRCSQTSRNYDIFIFISIFVMVILSQRF